MRHSVITALLAALVLASAGAGACHRPSEANGEDPGSPAPTPAIVIFEPAGGPRAAVSVDIVRTPEQIRRGLMFRRSMPQSHGMLFLMGQERIHSFWMRNTYIPLDMIFITRDMTVAGVVANAAPLTDDRRRIDRPSYYVLEVNAGWARAHGITAGTPVRFKNVRR